MGVDVGRILRHKEIWLDLPDTWPCQLLGGKVFLSCDWGTIIQDLSNFA
jgi:hypothetical protein